MREPASASVHGTIRQQEAAETGSKGCTQMPHKCILVGLTFNHRRGNEVVWGGTCAHTVPKEVWQSCQQKLPTPAQPAAMVHHGAMVTMCQTPNHTWNIDDHPRHSVDTASTCARNSSTCG